VVERFQARQRERQTTSVFQAWHVETILSRLEKDEAKVGTRPPPFWAEHARNSKQGGSVTTKKCTSASSTLQM
jgi:hypothetical protein